MPHEIHFDRPPAGYAITPARSGEHVSVQYIEFTSTEDGQHFIQRLEGFPTQIINKLAGRLDITPSQVDHFLAIIRRDGMATIYINELPQTARIRVGRAIKKGEKVFKNDIVDIDRLQLGEIDIPDDCGVAFLLSAGWRKGLFYDFGPLQSTPVPRAFDCEKVFGQLYSHILFQERFSISEEEWDALFVSKWFPFSGLTNETNDALINHIRANWNPDELIDKIVEEVKGRTESFIENWANHKVFQPHQNILRRAVEHFEDDDYLSCTGLLYPRIEGILRTNLNQRLGGKSSQSRLADAAVAAQLPNPKSLLLPHRFGQYLKTVYFADFDPHGEENDVSRHSVSHGVASTDKFDAKAAVIGILVVHHLSYCCGQNRNVVN